MGAFSKLENVVTNASQSQQPQYGQPQQPIGQAQDSLGAKPVQQTTGPMQNLEQSNDLQSKYPNTINQWDNSQQQTPFGQSFGKGSTTASSKLPSPLTKNQSMTGKGA